MHQRLNKVLLTRRRWDVYMMPLFLAAAAIAFVQVWQSGQLSFALAPVAVIALWLMLRARTPRKGMLVPTIRATPGAVVMLWFAAASLLSMAILVAVDTYVFHHPFRAPLEPYHVAIYAPPFLILIAGACRADRIKRAQMAKSSPDVDDGGIGQNDE